MQHDGHVPSAALMPSFDHVRRRLSQRRRPRWSESRKQRSLSGLKLLQTLLAILNLPTCKMFHF